MDNKTEAIVVGSNWSQHLEFSKECAFQSHFVSVTSKEDYAIIEDIQEHINSMTGMIILASPDNPTGWVASIKLLTLMNELVIDSDIVVIVDEEYLIDYSKSASRLSINFAITSSLSKMHGLPGLRLGWCVAHPNLIKRCLDAKRLSTMSNSIICEELAKIALSKEDVYLARGKELCRNGNDLIRKWIDINPKLEIMNTTEVLPYAWIKLLDNIDSMTFAQNALRHGVLIIPGEVFSQSGFIRLATGRNVDVINDGLKILTPLLSQ